ncbi:FAD-binding protein [Sphingobium estronivorans]|uniref:FAD-binding protein n=1 Tax=Sphingobium estronivorans TaxID=1577690 RepID=UPI001238D36B|nr:FAD-binding protein [Sphingobium estronivorans]
MIRPTDEAELTEAILDAAQRGARLAITGGGSKADMGRPVEAETLSLAGLAGIVDYDPAELVLTVRPGTPLAEVEALVASQGQMLAFEPFDHGPLFGRAAGSATIGGVIAAGAAGSRRLSAGGARDHLLGIHAVSGRGQAFVAGAKVVKNVTGYDLPKLATGSWGRLFALSELTLKVLPRPPMAVTSAIAGLTTEQAVRAMAIAMGSQAEIAAAAHIPASLRDGPALTLFRIEGFAPSVKARGEMLRTVLAAIAPVEPVDMPLAESIWRALRTLDPLPADRPLWRINIPPSGAPGVVAALEPHGAAWLADWAGGLLWIGFAGDPVLVRDAAARAGGHAMLVRAPAEMRAHIPAFHPQPAALAALEERVRRAFDPLGLFETGRF